MKLENHQKLKWTVKYVSQDPLTFLGRVLLYVSNQMRYRSLMNSGDITVTLTESQHELLNDIILHSLESYQLMSPYGDGIHELPIDNPIVQRYSMIDNMKELFDQLWTDRFQS